MSSWPFEGHSQVFNRLVNKSFQFDPAGQRFVNTCQFLAILLHRISMEGLPDPFFPYPNTKEKKWSGHARLG